MALTVGVEELLGQMVDTKEQLLSHKSCQHRVPFLKLPT